MPLKEIKPMSSYSPSTKDREAISMIEEDFTRGKQNRLTYEGQWYVNSAMLRGQQRVRWDTTEQTLVTPLAPSHKVRRSFN